MPRPGGAIRAPLLDASAEASAPAPAPAPASPTAGSGAGSLRLEPPAEPAPLADGARLENVVVGAGPAGLLAACLLAKAGTPVVVVDARARPTEFYGSFPVVLNMRGLTALAALGEEVADRFRAAGRAVRQLHVVPDNKTVAQVDTHGTCIMRDTAAGMLLSIADELGVPIHWNTKLLAIDLSTRQCTFEQRDGSVSLSAGRLIAADGNWSKVRRICEEQAGLQVETEEWGVQLRYMLAPDPPPGTLPEAVDGSVHYVLGADGYVCQQPNGQWSVSISAPGDAEANDWLLSDDPSPENIGKLRALCEAKAAPFARHLLTSDEVYASHFSCRTFTGEIVKCSSLAPVDWIALVGDAGHAVAPFTGEGMNSALESAALLARVVNAGGTCAQYDEQRREDAHALWDIALRNKTIVVGTPREKCANTFTTVMLGIGKGMGCVAGTIQDYMLGKKAEQGVWSYSDLIALDRRQRCCWYPCGGCCFLACCCCCGRCG